MNTREIVDEFRHDWICTVLTVAGTEAQRRSFIDGYNGAECRSPRTAAKLRAHALGAKVSAILNPERAASQPKDTDNGR